MIPLNLKEFTVKEVTAVSRLGIDNPTRIVYLKIKAFVPSDRNIETQKSKILKGLDTYY